MQKHGSHSPAQYTTNVKQHRVLTPQFFTTIPRVNEGDYRQLLVAHLQRTNPRFKLGLKAPLILITLERKSYTMYASSTLHTKIVC